MQPGSDIIVRATRTQRLKGVRGILATEKSVPTSNHAIVALSRPWTTELPSASLHVAKSETHSSVGEDDDVENVPRLDRLMGQGRVDPFDSYPIPSQPFYPALIDHCTYSKAGLAPSCELLRLSDRL